MIDNLWIVKPKADEQKIVDTCEKVKIRDFIETLPNQYYIIIGESGQKQRLTLARTLLLNTKIILFNEVLFVNNGVVKKCWIEWTL